MENLDLSNPFLLIFGGLVLLIILYFWNKKNQATLRSRKNKSFRERYKARKNAEQEKH